MCKKRITLSIALVLVMSLFMFFFSIAPGFADRYEVKAQQHQELPSTETEDITFGAWVPTQLHLEEMQGDERVNAIHTLLSQGYNEYYLVMRDFSNSTERGAIESLLGSTDITNLGIIIILLPQGEGGTESNYDWNGWIQYFNSLKERHPSFLGFAVDDFNAIVELRRIRLMNSMDLMGLSNFSYALSFKREDVQFYPVMYIETGEFKTLKDMYNNYTAGIILVSTLFHNVSALENELAKISKLFENKPLKFIVYPEKSGFNSPSDRLIMATLSIASRWVGGIIVYVNSDSPVVQDYIQNHMDPQYMSAIKEMERLQVKHEIIDSRKDIVMCTSCLFENN